MQSLESVWKDQMSMSAGNERAFLIAPTTRSPLPIAAILPS